MAAERGSMRDVITVGVLAHVDAGKTTLCEQILYHGGALRQPGRVDHADTLLDSHQIEQRRGITIFSGQADLCWQGRRFFLVDTPGHVDFSPEMERVLPTLDCAVLVISAAEGLQAHSLTIWSLLRRLRIPVFFFINKTDLPGADLPAVLAELRQKCSPDLLQLTNGIDEAACEQAALTDEALLEHYLAGTLSPDAALSALRQAVRERRLFPVYHGSALRDEGVTQLLDGLLQLTGAQYDADAPLAAHLYQIRHDRQGNRVAFLKLLAGRLRPKDSLNGEKVHELRRYQGEKYSVLPLAEAGDLVAVTGLTEMRSGETAGAAVVEKPQLTPLLMARVTCESGQPLSTVLAALRMLEEEEPTLQLHWQEELQEIQIAVMGKIQLEVLRETALSRFGLALAFGECRVLYRETIRGSVRGCGHFEPLRHYAEVHLQLEEAPRGSGVCFVSHCTTDALALHWQRLIETHVLEREHPGALAGAPLTDVRVVLLAGQAHLKHTEGGDFREATYRAIRHALFHAENVLLEPYYAVTAEVPAALAGRVISDLRRMHGTAEAPQTQGAESVVRGRCPVAEMMRYQEEFTTFTRGAGRLQLEFDGYAECQDTAAALAEIGYDRERDAANPADSVFCAHGAGYTVKWQDAAAMMHCQP